MKIYTEIKNEKQWNQVLAELEERSKVKWPHGSIPTKPPVVYSKDLYALYLDSGVLWWGLKEKHISFKKLSSRAFIDAVVKALPKPARIRKTKAELVAEIVELKKEISSLKKKIGSYEFKPLDYVSIEAIEKYNADLKNLNEYLTKCNDKLENENSNLCVIANNREKIIETKIAQMIEIQNRCTRAITSAESAEEELKQLKEILELVWDCMGAE